MNDPAGCTALVLYAGDSGDGLSPATESEAGGDAATPAGSATCSSGGDRCLGSQSSALSSFPQKREKSASQQTHETPRRFVGLSNQGATCYMNSLLQTLYMTPEFRAALYAWKHEHHVAYGGAGGEGGGACDDADTAEDPSECIPLQLQRLFAQLQMSDRECIETRALTDSFGWTAQDSFQQHDVQELCRVLFDALESTFQGTVNEKLVNDLYQGSLRDYVTCKECHAESSRLDNFLDVSLVLRPFGSDQTMKSVTESLEYFLKPEVLDCDNQYCCQACGKKVDAVKGLKFERLPYLLSLQLKRFDFDYTTLQRIKLNDEMRFPMVLDMNKYVDNPACAEGGEGFAAVEGGRQKHRSDFQRSLSLEKRKLQGLLGLVNEAESEGERAGVGVDRGQTAGEAEASGAREASQCCGGARGLEGVDGLVGAKGGAGEGGRGSDAKGSAGSVDPDTDETDREEGSMDSVESTEAKLDMADLPGLEDYWGNSFEETAAGEDSSSASASAGRVENHRGGSSTGTGSERTGGTWGGGGGATLQGDHGEDEDESFVPEEHEDDPLKLLRENGPWVYELFAVLIHSGSALGGHYYAHIKSLGDDGGWFTFNDSRVSSTTEEVVKQAWGGRWSQTSTWQRRSATSSGTGNGVAFQRSSTASSSPPPTSSATKWGSSAANAYMLMYRRVDPLKNKRHLRRDEVPEHVRQQVLEQDRRAQEAAAEAAAAAIARQSSIKIRVLLNGGKESTITGDKRKPLSELADAAAEAFGVDREALVPMSVVGPPGRQWTKGVPDEEDSAGGETDRETQDEGRSDCGGSAVDLSGSAGDIESSDPKTLGEIEFTSGMTTQAVTKKSLESEQQTRVVSERLIRLREHLTTPKLPGAPYEETSTPGELSFFPGKVVWLETKEPRAPWSHFDPKDVNIAMVRFDRETEGTGKVSERACGTTGGLLGTPWLSVGDAGQDSAGETATTGSAAVRSSNGPKETGDGDEKVAAVSRYSLIPLPILGKFSSERNTRLQASGTTREIRAALAAFAGTDEARTRVFTMNSDNAERTYKLLCPPLKRRYSTKRFGEEFRWSSNSTSLAAQQHSDMKGQLRAATMVSGVATQSSVVSKARGSETSVGLDTAEDGGSLGSSTIVGTWLDGGTSSSDGFAWEHGGSSDNVREQERAMDDQNDGEDNIVKLGEPGVSLLHKVYVEEVPEEECGMEEKQSLAVRVATDGANRITIKLCYHDGMTGPDSVTADKRWTSDQFREFLALLLGRGNRSFRIRKGQAQTPEVRPGFETLRSLMFYNHISVHLSPGRPLEHDEEALTIIPLDMGFPPGVASPPASVIQALAGGKNQREEESKQGGRLPSEKTESGLLLDDDGLSKRDACTTGGGIDGGSGDTSCLYDSRSAPGSARSSGEGTSRLSRSAMGGDGESPSTELRTGQEAKEATVKMSAASALVVARKECDEAGSVPSEALSGTSDSERSAEVPVALANGGATGSSTAGGSSSQVAAVFVQAAAVAAASAERSNAETEILTRTTVEGIPAASCWGEDFTMAVKMKSSVAQVREAVWEELKRRGLVPSTVASCRASRSLRLRDKLGPRPARIIRDSDGRLSPVSSRHSGGPRVLVAQVLSRDENLGSRDSSTSGGGDELGGNVSEPTLRHDDAVANGADALGGGAPPTDATVIVVQWWDRWSWRLTQQYEAWVRGAETVASARNRLAKQVGVDPSNLRAHKCSYSSRLRLCDLGGYSTGRRAHVVPGSGVPVEAGGWGTASGNVSASSCRWEDLDASHANVAVGWGTFSDGDRVLLQDISQPLKELSAATRASIGAADSCKGAWSSSSARASSIDSEGCDMTSIGSWYPGSSTAPSGTVDDSGVTVGTLTRTSKPWSPSSSSATSAATTSSLGSAFKPKERALRIRTRRDRLQEGKASATANGATTTAIAAAAAVATAAAAATIATAAATAIAVGSATSSCAGANASTDGSCSAPVEHGSGADGSEGMLRSSSNGAPPASAIASGNNRSSNGNDVTMVDTGSPGSSSDVTVVGRGGLEASSPGGDTVASSSSGSHAHGDAAGAMNSGPKASSPSGDVYGTTSVQDGDYQDLWGPWDDVPYMDSSVKIRSSAEDVARSGGVSQFEDLA